MPTMTNKAGDVRVVTAGLVGMLERTGYKVTADPAELKGAALDDALRAAELPTSGTAAEKRERLATGQD